MGPERDVNDSAQRERALDPSTSFIVQAPAGSGKTELLTQRFLRLLATVEHPEEVLAITFTRKAAGEMRERILAALRSAADPRPAQPHRAATWDLASAAAARDTARGWHLLATPGRLRVQTIDGLCAALTRQLPVLSAFGAPPSVVESAEAHYETSARHTVAALEEELGAALGTVLPHLDNDIGRLVRLLADALPRREQWLPHLVTEHPRHVLEAALEDAVVAQLERTAGLCPPGLAGEMTRLARYAGDNLDDATHPLACWRGRDALPGTAPGELAPWLGLAELLLVRGGPELRRRVDARLGFPAKTAGRDADEKARFQQAKQDHADLMEALAHHPDFVAEIDACRHLPPTRYSDPQWAVLQALREVLVRSAAELGLVFAERGEVDFVEVHSRALQALGTEEEPTDLALALDYRLRHILVDEFQDTSSGQYRLIEKLTAGWQAGDGRTLFLVGDPMQSIYGFREADVGLFLETRRHGIGGLPLEPLTLAVNFRSQAGLVDWVNTVFADVFPAAADPGSGAVPYSASVPFRDAGHGQAVAVHAAGIRDDAAEGEQVAGLVAQALAAEPDASIAVLGRSRGHLLGCVRALKRAGIRFQAIDLEPLVERLVVQDLLALTRALLHAGDRLAWCTLLRSPVCGLALPDLLAAVGEGLDTPVWPRLDDPAVTTALSDDGRARVARLHGILADILARRRRGSLRQWVEGAWIRLGGPATLTEALDREAAAAYFELLGREARADDIPDLAAFDQALSRLYAPPDPAADGRVQVMTMHKAKGLEFDVVILPGLGKSPRQDDPPLLDWRERPDRRGEPSLLLAPIRAAREDAEPIQAFLRRLRTTRARLEDARLLYVAATRARRRLHLLGHATPAARTGAPAPQPQSLLARIWPRVEHAFGAVPTAQAALPALEAPAAWPLLRLPADWAPAALPPALRHAGDSATAQDTDDPVLFDWAGQTARHVGTLVHRWLERIARDGPDAWPVARIHDCRARLASGLQLLGVAEEALGDAVERCVRGLGNAVGDPRGRWILEPHAEHRVEYALTLWQAGKARHHVIDRTFVDADGVRWIIDYKTGQHQGGDPEDFLDRERERYQAQLAGYAAAFARLEDRPIRLGLYFPLLPGWREWAP